MSMGWTIRWPGLCRAAPREGFGARSSGRIFRAAQALKARKIRRKARKIRERREKSAKGAKNPKGRRRSGRARPAAGFASCGRSHRGRLGSGNGRENGFKQTDDGPKEGLPGVEPPTRSLLEKRKMKGVKRIRNGFENDLASIGRRRRRVPCCEKKSSFKMDLKWI